MGNDVADPSQTELAYTEQPPAALLSLLDAVAALQDELPRDHCPALVITSEQDHVVAPGSSDHFAGASAARSSGCASMRSFHVATLDYERADIEARAVAFANRAVGGNG